MAMFTRWQANDTPLKNLSPVLIIQDLKATTYNLPFGYASEVFDPSKIHGLIFYQSSMIIWETTCHTPTILGQSQSNPFEGCCFSFLVSTDATNLFRQRFRKPCADENVASASSWLHRSLPRASALVGLGDMLPRPRCRGCFSILWEYYCVF